MLENLYKKVGIVTRMISSENPTGEKGKACMDEIDPDNPSLYYSRYALKKGYKVNPFRRIEPKSTLTIASVAGMGVINQIFLTSDRPNFSELIFRIYWDNEENPSVEVPLGAFFCMGHDSNPNLVNSLPIVVAPYRGCNCYFQMPFREGFKMEIENKGDTITQILAYKVLYTETVVEPDASYFHSQYRETLTSSEDPTHILLDDVRGKGVYVGTYMAWTQKEPGWWGEGEVKFYIDGDEEYPTICDNGTEDYFGGAWNFGGCGMLEGSTEIEFNTPFLGLPLVEHNGEIDNRFSMYRFHILDPIGFKENLKVTVDTIGWEEDHSKYRHTCEYVQSVVYYYQTEPHNKF